MEFDIISSKEAIDFLLPKHYSGRKPQITKAFGWYDKGILKAVCTFGKPATPSICSGICGEKWKYNVYELNRLCRTEDLKEQLSEFVSDCLWYLKPENWIVVSYSDTAMNHHGYIYQACNFIYTGATKQRTDCVSNLGNHARHYDKNNLSEYRKIRSSKHRYVYFCAENKRIKKEMLKDFTYPILPYPKGDNSNYVLGEYLKEQYVKSK